MTEANENLPIAHRVSAVTKHIKLYSDNPIHRALDAVIDRVEMLDDLDDTYYYANQLVKYVEKLHFEAMLLAQTEQIKYLERIKDGQTYN